MAYKPPQFDTGATRKDYMIALDKLQVEVEAVRNNNINWQSYHQGRIIEKVDYDLIKEFDKASKQTKSSLLATNGVQYAKSFLALLRHIPKESTTQYILTLIDDVLHDFPEHIDNLFQQARKQRTGTYNQLLALLSREDAFIANQAARIVVKMALHNPDLIEKSELSILFNWIKDELQKPGNEYMQNVAACLIKLLGNDEYKHVFVEHDCIQTVITVLDSKIGFQLQYQLACCLWLLSFDPQICEDLPRYNVVPILADILSEAVKDKVVRIILALFRNMLEKPEDHDAIHENCLTMIQYKVLKTLDILQKKEFDDPDMTDDIKFLTKTLEDSFQEISSFDEYSSEVKSGRLEWSPVHKSDKFWRENAAKLNAKDYELIKALTKLLGASTDPLILSVASHDVGEYVRYYPRGKKVLDQIGCKTLVMSLMGHDDPNVRYEALLATQKIMVQNCTEFVYCITKWNT